MKSALFLTISVICCFCMGCSLAPQRLITKEQLYKTGIYNYYTIKESPERVLTELNKEGEVVLEAEYRKQPIYMKILATADGLRLSVLER